MRYGTKHIVRVHSARDAFAIVDIAYACASWKNSVSSRVVAHGNGCVNACASVISRGDNSAAASNFRRLGCETRSKLREHTLGHSRRWIGFIGFGVSLLFRVENLPVNSIKTEQQKFNY